MTKSAYHHGNLREALLEMAIETLEEEGMDALSLRRLARDAGVSSTAPYSHFKTKRELLAAIATTGYQQLKQKLDESFTDELSADERLHSGLRAYTLFAIEHPVLFSLMFGTKVAGFIEYEDLLVAMSETYSTIEESVALTLPAQASEIDIKVATYAVWAKAQGLATLITDDKLKAQDIGVDDQAALVDRILALRI